MAKTRLSIKGFKSNNQFNVFMKELNKKLKHRYDNGIFKYSLTIEITQEANIYNSQRLNKLTNSIYIESWNKDDIIDVLWITTEIKKKYDKMECLSITFAH